MAPKIKIFISYAREDEERVKELYNKLLDEGFKPWMATQDILAGEIWEDSIQKAIRISDRFLACMSFNSVNKRGFVQKEINEGLEKRKEKLPVDRYFIPVRLEECEIPDNINIFQWVDFFKENGWSQLLKSLRRGTETIGSEEEKIEDIEPYGSSDEMREELISILQSIDEMLDMQVRSYLLRKYPPFKLDGLQKKRHRLMRIDLINIIDHVIYVGDVVTLIKNAIDFVQSPTLKKRLEVSLKRYRKTLNNRTIIRKSVNMKDFMSDESEKCQKKLEEIERTKGTTSQEYTKLFKEM